MALGKWPAWPGQGLVSRLRVPGRSWAFGQEPRGRLRASWAAQAGHRMGWRMTGETALSDLGSGKESVADVGELAGAGHLLAWGLMSSPTLPLVSFGDNGT